LPNGCKNTGRTELIIKKDILKNPDDIDKIYDYVSSLNYINNIKKIGFPKTALFLELNEDMLNRYDLNYDEIKNLIVEKLKLKIKEIPAKLTIIIFIDDIYNSEKLSSINDFKLITVKSIRGMRIRLADIALLNFEMYPDDLIVDNEVVFKIVFSYDVTQYKKLKKDLRKNIREEYSLNFIDK
jgi:Cu/Ag efflux pump CusA